MSLCIVGHLQFVFDVSQENVAGRQRLVVFVRNQRPSGYCREPLKSIARTDFRYLAAMADLERLQDELDFAYAACTQLDVSSALTTLDHLEIDLLLHVADVLQCSGIQRTVV